MSTATDTPREPAAPRRPVDVLFDNYSNDHRNATNQKIHVVCVPAILWSVIALLWCIPSPGTWFRAGFWAGVAMFVAWAWYYRASRRLAFGMLAMFVLMAWPTRWFQGAYGTMNLLYLAIGVFVVAWIGQFIGHSKLFEGRKPSFLTDLQYLLVGPAWVLAKLYRKLGWRY